MNGALLTHSAEIGVPAHTANHLLLLSVTNAVGIVVSAEVVGGSGPRSRKGGRGRGFARASRATYGRGRTGRETGRPRRRRGSGFAPRIGELTFDRRRGRVWRRRCVRSASENIQLPTQERHRSLVVVVIAV